MASFPTVYPNSISFDHGQSQVSEYTAFGIGPIRFRNNDFVNGQIFSLTYTNIQQASVDLIRTHYTESQGTLGSFTVPTAVLGSVGVTDSSSVYRYVETPQEEHFGVYFNVTVTLQALEGVTLRLNLDGGPATLPAEAAFTKYVFDGTSPFILNGTDSATATLILNASQI